MLNFLNDPDDMARSLCEAWSCLYFLIMNINLCLNLVRVSYATGEVRSRNTNINKPLADGRGIVVTRLRLLVKDPKHLVIKGIFKFNVTIPTITRSYSTRSSINKLAPVQEQQVIPKDLLILAKHWKVCYNNTKRIFGDLRGLLKQESIWLAAYLRLAKNKVSKTLGSDYDTISYLTKNRILENRDLVLAGMYLWTGIRRIEIPGPGKTRPLGVFSIKDRLVQEVVRSIIEPIFECSFNDQSYGFRPNRGCDTALKWINTNMKDSIWYVEGDIKSYFYTIDIEKLMVILNHRITDNTILKLIRSGFKTRVFMLDMTYFTPEVGTPQSGILSPLLSNIYLHEFDEFMTKLNLEDIRPIKLVNRTNNLPALKLLYLKKSGNKARYHKLRISSPLPSQKVHRCFKYIRYAHIFIVGIVGARSKALKVRDQINTFLQDELNINLSTEKFKITHVCKGIEFLGHKLTRRVLFVRQRFAGKLITRKVTIPVLDVNMKRVIHCLKEAKFCDDYGDPLPVLRWLRLSQADVNVKVNQILRGLSEWWTITGNRRQALARVAYIIRYSVAKMYAAKFKLPTAASVFKITGHNLEKAIGARKKSAIGSDANLGNIQGILFHKYYKIP